MQQQQLVLVVLAAADAFREFEKCPRRVSQTKETTTTRILMKKIDTRLIHDVTTKRVLLLSTRGGDMLRRQRWQNLSF